MSSAGALEQLLRRILPPETDAQDAAVGAQQVDSGHGAPAAPPSHPTDRRARSASPAVTSPSRPASSSSLRKARPTPSTSPAITNTPGSSGASGAAVAPNTVSILDQQRRASGRAAGASGGVGATASLSVQDAGVSAGYGSRAALSVSVGAGAGARPGSAQRQRDVRSASAHKRRAYSPGWRPGTADANLAGTAVQLQDFRLTRSPQPARPASSTSVALHSSTTITATAAVAATAASSAQRDMNDTNDATSALASRGRGAGTVSSGSGSFPSPRSAWGAWGPPPGAPQLVPQRSPRALWRPGLPIPDPAAGSPAAGGGGPQARRTASAGGGVAGRAASALNAKALAGLGSVSDGGAAGGAAGGAGVGAVGGAGNQAQAHDAKGLAPSPAKSSASSARAAALLALKRRPRSQPRSGGSAPGPAAGAASGAGAAGSGSAAAGSSGGYYASASAGARAAALASPTTAAVAAARARGGSLGGFSRADLDHHERQDLNLEAHEASAGAAAAAAGAGPGSRAAAAAIGGGGGGAAAPPSAPRAASGAATAIAQAGVDRRRQGLDTHRASSSASTAQPGAGSSRQGLEAHTAASGAATAQPEAFRSQQGLDTHMAASGTVAGELLVPSTAAGAEPLSAAGSGQGGGTGTGLSRPGGLAQGATAGYARLHGQGQLPDAAAAVGSGSGGGSDGRGGSRSVSPGVGQREQDGASRSGLQPAVLGQEHGSGARGEQAQGRDATVGLRGNHSQPQQPQQPQQQQQQQRNEQHQKGLQQQQLRQQQHHQQQGAATASPAKPRATAEDDALVASMGGRHPQGQQRNPPAPTGSDSPLGLGSKSMSGSAVLLGSSAGSAGAGGLEGMTLTAADRLVGGARRRASSPGAGQVQAPNATATRSNSNLNAPFGFGQGHGKAGGGGGGATGGQRVHPQQGHYSDGGGAVPAVQSAWPFDRSLDVSIGGSVQARLPAESQREGGGRGTFTFAAAQALSAGASAERGAVLQGAEAELERLREVHAALLSQHHELKALIMEQRSQWEFELLEARQAASTLAERCRATEAAAAQADAQEAELKAQLAKLVVQHDMAVTLAARVHNDNKGLQAGLREVQARAEEAEAREQAAQGRVQGAERRALEADRRAAAAEARAAAALSRAEVLQARLGAGGAGALARDSTEAYLSGGGGSVGGGWGVGAGGVDALGEGGTGRGAAGGSHPTHGAGVVGSAGANAAVRGPAAAAGIAGTNAAGTSVGAGAVQAAGTDGVAAAALRARNRGLERVVAAERQAKDKAEREAAVLREEVRVLLAAVQRDEALSYVLGSSSTADHRGPHQQRRSISAEHQGGRQGQSGRHDQQGEGWHRDVQSQGGAVQHTMLIQGDDGGDEGREPGRSPFGSRGGGGKIGQRVSPLQARGPVGRSRTPEAMQGRHAQVSPHGIRAGRVTATGGAAGGATGAAQQAPRAEVADGQSAPHNRFASPSPDAVGRGRAAAAAGQLPQGRGPGFGLGPGDRRTSRSPYQPKGTARTAPSGGGTAVQGAGVRAGARSPQGATPASRSPSRRPVLLLLPVPPHAATAAAAGKVQRPAPRSGQQPLQPSRGRQIGVWGTGPEGRDEQDGVAYRLGSVPGAAGELVGRYGHHDTLGSPSAPSPDVRMQQHPQRGWDQHPEHQGDLGQILKESDGQPGTEWWGEKGHRGHQGSAPLLEGETEGGHNHQDQMGFPEGSVSVPGLSEGMLMLTPGGQLGGRGMWQEAMAGALSPASAPLRSARTASPAFEGDVAGLGLPVAIPGDHLRSPLQASSGTESTALFHDAGQAAVQHTVYQIGLDSVTSIAPHAAIAAGDEMLATGSPAMASVGAGAAAPVSPGVAGRQAQLLHEQQQQRRQQRQQQQLVGQGQHLSAQLHSVSVSITSLAVQQQQHLPSSPAPSASPSPSPAPAPAPSSHAHHTPANAAEPHTSHTFHTPWPPEEVESSFDMRMASPYKGHTAGAEAHAGTYPWRGAPGASHAAAARDGAVNDTALTEGAFQGSGMGQVGVMAQGTSGASGASSALTSGANAGAAGAASGPAVAAAAGAEGPAGVDAAEGCGGLVEGAGWAWVRTSGSPPEGLARRPAGSALANDHVLLPGPEAAWQLPLHDSSGEAVGQARGRDSDGGEGAGMQDDHHRDIRSPPRPGDRWRAEPGFRLYPVMQSPLSPPPSAGHQQQQQQQQQQARRVTTGSPSATRQSPRSLASPVDHRQSAGGHSPQSPSSASPTGVSLGSVTPRGSKGSGLADSPRQPGAPLVSREEQRGQHDGQRHASAEPAVGSMRDGSPSHQGSDHAMRSPPALSRSSPSPPALSPSSPSPPALSHSSPSPSGLSLPPPPLSEGGHVATPRALIRSQVEMAQKTLSSLSSILSKYRNRAHQASGDQRDSSLAEAGDADGDASLTAEQGLPGAAQQGLTGTAHQGLTGTAQQGLTGTVQQALPRSGGAAASGTGGGTAGQRVRQALSLVSPWGAPVQAGSTGRAVQQSAPSSGASAQPEADGDNTGQQQQQQWQSQQQAQSQQQVQPQQQAHLQQQLGSVDCIVLGGGGVEGMDAGATEGPEVAAEATGALTTALTALLDNGLLFNQEQPQGQGQGSSHVHTRLASSVESSVGPSGPASIEVPNCVDRSIPFGQGGGLAHSPVTPAGAGSTDAGTGVSMSGGGGLAFASSAAATPVSSAPAAGLREGTPLSVRSVAGVSPGHASGAGVAPGSARAIKPLQLSDVLRRRQGRSDGLLNS